MFINHSYPVAVNIMVIIAVNGFITVNWSTPIKIRPIRAIDIDTCHDTAIYLV
jgi:hypothetical protein